MFDCLTDPLRAQAEKDSDFTEDCDLGRRLNREDCERHHCTWQPGVCVRVRACVRACVRVCVCVCVCVLWVWLIIVLFLVSVTKTRA